MFDVQHVIIKMGDSLRPGRMILYKSTTDPNSMVTWVYRVTDTADCTNLYKQPIMSSPMSLTSIPCTYYQTGAVTNEVVRNQISSYFSNVCPFYSYLRNVFVKTHEMRWYLVENSQTQRVGGISKGRKPKKVSSLEGTLLEYSHE